MNIGREEVPYCAHLEQDHLDDSDWLITLSKGCEN